MADESAHDERQVELQRDEHAQSEGQGGDAAGIEDDGYHGTDTVEQPRGALSRHEGLDDSGHGACLRRSHHISIVGSEAVSLVEYHDDAAYRCGRHEYAEEFVSLLVFGRTAEPVANLQVGDERAGRGERCAYHAAHDEGGHHAACAFESYDDHDDGGENERHERHAAHGIGADYGDGVGRNGGEEESYDSYDEDADDCKE